MRTTRTPAASTPDLEAYTRVHRLLRFSAAELADRLGDPESFDDASNRALRHWYRGFAGEIRCHHHIEDELLFPALRDRVAVYGELEPRLVSDHEEVDDLLDRLGSALGECDALTAASLAVALRDHLDEHLGFEDDEISPLFARHFTAVEWDELNERAVRMTSPKQLVFTAPWMMSLLDTAEGEELLSSVPKALTVLWVFTRRRYARTASRAFGPRRAGEVS